MGRRNGCIAPDWLGAIVPGTASMQGGDFFDQDFHAFLEVSAAQEPLVKGVYGPCFETTGQRREQPPKD